MKVKINYDEDWDVVNVWFYERKDNGYTEVVKPMNLIVQSMEIADKLPEPTLRLERGRATEFLQSLAEALVASGFKPDEIKVQNKQIEAMKYHLEDMRKIVFKGAK